MQVIISNIVQVLQSLKAKETRETSRENMMKVTGNFGSKHKQEEPFH